MIRLNRKISPFWLAPLPPASAAIFLLQWKWVEKGFQGTDSESTCFVLSVFFGPLFSLMFLVAAAGDSRWNTGTVLLIVFAGWLPPAVMLIEHLSRFN